MAEVELIAKKDFSYMTRRLKAGDTFPCKSRDVRVLTGIGLARLPREAGSLPKPPASLMTRVMKSDGAEPVKAPRQGRARKAAAKKG